MHWCQLKVSLAVETAAIQTKPAYAGYRNLDLSLVRDGGLRLCSREFDEAVGELVEGQAPHPAAVC